MPEAIIADLHQAAGQHMLEEATDELQGVQGHGALTVAVGFAVAAGDLIVFDLDDAAVGNGHLKDLGGQVLDGALAGPDGLTVDVPLHGPDLGGDLPEQAGLGQEITELGPVLERALTGRKKPGLVGCHG